MIIHRDFIVLMKETTRIIPLLSPLNAPRHCGVKLGELIGRYLWSSTCPSQVNHKTSLACGVKHATTASFLL